MQSEMQNTCPVAVATLPTTCSWMSGLGFEACIPGVCLRLLPGVTFYITKITSIYEYVLIFLLIFTDIY